jgi:hypothetical protein
MTGSVGNYRRARRNMKKHFFLFFVYTLPRRGSSYTPRNCSCFLTLSSCIYNYRYTSLSQHTILLHQCRHLLISIEMSQFFFILRREKRKELVYGVCVFRVWESAFLGAFFFAVSFVAVVALQPCLALSLSPHVYCLGCVTFLLLFLSLFERVFFSVIHRAMAILFPHLQGSPPLLTLPYWLSDYSAQSVFPPANENVTGKAISFVVRVCLGSSVFVCLTVGEVNASAMKKQQ